MKRELSLLGSSSDKDFPLIDHPLGAITVFKEKTEGDLDFVPIFLFSRKYPIRARQVQNRVSDLGQRTA
jgi:hypothetical protein